MNDLDNDPVTDSGLCGDRGCAMPATVHLLANHPVTMLTLGLCDVHTTLLTPYLTILAGHPFQPSCAHPGAFWQTNIAGHTWCGP